MGGGGGGGGQGAKAKVHSTFWVVGGVGGVGWGGGGGGGRGAKAKVHSTFWVVGGWVVCGGWWVRYGGLGCVCMVSVGGVEFGRFCGVE